MNYALVTGGSRGIGRAACLQLASQGFAILVNYVSNEQKARETADLVAAAGGRASFRAEFVSDADQRPEGVLLSMNFPASRFGGLGWTADARPGVFPPAFTPGTPETSTVV